MRDRRQGVPSPKVKVTVPVGLPAPGAMEATVAVMVVDWPTTVGSGEEVTAVVVAALLTVWVSVPLDAVKLASPS
ncbi:hypothetical protein [Streptomyces sp. BRA346]|uniref:hypothetical protein n=1 Tax=Streptomyces sp. BRA346 TaxID=2878199 RepID=UPI0040642E00